MPRVKKESLKHLLSSTSLINHISKYVSLKRSGSRHKGLCPFHQEKTPSFYVYDDWFYCFGCQAHGNLIAFEKYRTNLSFPEIVEQLSGEYNIPLEYEDGEDSQQHTHHEYIFFLFREIHRLYQSELQKSPLHPAYDYLNKRGFTHQDIQQFELGWAPSSGTFLKEQAQKRGWDLNTLVQVGLLRPQSYQDFFQNRLLFPIHNHQGKIVAFGGRILDFQKGQNAPKYLNSPEHELFKKRQILYLFSQAKSPIAKSNMAIVVEGYMDALTLHQKGFTNTTAVLGTQLTEFHLRALNRYAQHLLICLDGDQAGSRGLQKVFQHLFPLNLMNIRVIQIPTGLDPADFLSQHPPSAFQNLIQQSQPLLSVVWEHLAQESVFKDNSSLLRLAQTELVPVILQLPDPAARNLALKFLSNKLGLSRPEYLIRNQTQTIVSSPPPAQPAAPHIELKLRMSPIFFRFLATLSFIPYGIMRQSCPLIWESLINMGEPQNAEEVFLSLTWHLEPLVTRQYLQNWLKWYMSHPEDTACYLDETSPQDPEPLGLILFWIFKTAGQLMSLKEFQICLQECHYAQSVQKTLKNLFSPSLLTPKPHIQDFFHIWQARDAHDFCRSLKNLRPHEIASKILKLFFVIQKNTLPNIELNWSGYTVPFWNQLPVSLQKAMDHFQKEGSTLLKKYKAYLDLTEKKYKDRLDKIFKNTMDL